MSNPLHYCCPCCAAPRGVPCYAERIGSHCRPHRARVALASNPALSPPPGFLEGSKFKQPLFHGTAAAVDTGHSLKPDEGDEYGIYLAPSHRYARQYGPRLARVLVSIKSPLVVESKAEISPTDLTRADVRRLEDAGYDGIVVRSAGRPPSEVVAFRPTQVWVTEVV